MENTKINVNNLNNNFETNEGNDIVCPISSSCLRNISDKVYEKRKSGALEIQKLVKNLVIINDKRVINNVIQTLNNDFIMSHNVNARKGGCISLAATAIGLEKFVTGYVSSLVNPVVSCFYDSDNGVRYYACEALYNIVKVCRSAILVSHENTLKEVFIGLSKLACDTDLNVQNGSQPLDRLLKDIIIENQQTNTSKYSSSNAVNKNIKNNDELIKNLIDMLKDMIYTKNSFGRQFVVSWLSLLNDITQDQNKLLTLNLPKLLDGLLLILDDENLQVKKSCQNLLQQFLNEISTSSESNNTMTSSLLNQMDAPTLINILIIHCKSNNEFTQEIALSWIKTFVIKLSSDSNLNQNLLPFFPSILAATLPCLRKTDDLNNNNINNAKKKNMSETAEVINKTLLNLIITWGHNHSINNKIDKLTNISDGKIIDTLDTGAKLAEVDLNKIEGGDKNSTTMTNDNTTKKIKKLVKSNSLDIRNLIMILMSHIQHSSEQTRLSVLNWVSHLFTNMPEKMYPHIGEIFPVLLNTLLDSSEEVVLLDIKVLSQISSLSHFDNFITSLVELFKTKFFQNNSCSNIINPTVNSFFDNRSSFIIRKLCLYLDPYDIYTNFAKNLSQQSESINKITNGDINLANGNINNKQDSYNEEKIKKFKFTSKMVDLLNSILLTTPELYTLRNELKRLSNQKSYKLFENLYKLWCYNPIATLALCLLTQNFEHSFHLLQSFGDINITVEFLVEIDKLIQLLESPVFMFLRLKLLEPQDQRFSFLKQ
ncbi:protein VAC14 homolog isoform X2 [Gordionus sp. m RMFG-2023]|uniref:protein VAC14 homolog isoform X2 n=1 Tax=Gordionus sp. m RMFG-2023 TaxID=3053472 RepID=UPI0031FC715B